MAIRFNPGDTRGAIVEPENYPYAPSLQLNADALRARIILTGDIELLPPINGVDGCSLEAWLYADGADRNLTFDTQIGLGFNLAPQPYVIDAGTTYVLKMRYDGPRNLWGLDGLIDSF